MTTKFAVLNPQTAQYSFADDRDSAIALIASMAVEFYLQHAHNQLCSVVVTNDDGSENWFTADGESRLSPQEIEAELMRQIQAQAVLNRSYGQLPVTETGGGNA